MCFARVILRTDPTQEEGAAVPPGTRTGIEDDTARVELVVLQDELVGPVRSSLI